MWLYAVELGFVEWWVKHPHYICAIELSMADWKVDKILQNPITSLSDG